MSALPHSAPTALPARISPAEVALLASVFVVAACGLLYELAAGALASYLLGDSVLQFSHHHRHLPVRDGRRLVAVAAHSSDSSSRTFLRVELLVGLIGGLMPAALFVAHNLLAHVAAFRWLLYALVLLIGTLVGLEIPLVMRILKRHFGTRWQLRELVSQVLTFDYLGALAVAVAFPLLLVPQLGLIRTGIVFGLLNAAVAAWALWLFRSELRALGRHVAACVLVIAALLVAAVGADRLTTWAEDRFYGDRIVHATSSAYQRVVVTASDDGALRLYLNGNLQFHSRDEYRYHEALVHPAMAAHGGPRRVAILGGGDGLALREVLKHPSVEQVTLVELDPAHHDAVRARSRLLTALNGGALASPKLTHRQRRRVRWLERSDDSFDVIIVDFPDPTNFSLGKLYTTSFYALLDAASPPAATPWCRRRRRCMARRSFWTVVATIEAAGLTATPYHAHVPSFGEWGFVIAHRRPWRMPAALPPGLRFLSVDGLPALFQFPPDMARVPMPSRTGCRTRAGASVRGGMGHGAER